MRKKLLAAVLAGVLTFATTFTTTNAATREEIASINVEKATDFTYWNDNSLIKKKIVDFVEDAINPNSLNYIPPENRIATFDMDGTFYCETAPLYFQETMFLHRVLEDETYQAPKKIVKFAEKIKPKIYNKTGLTPAENKLLAQQLTKAYAGMTPEEYRSYVRKFMDTNETGLTNLKRGEAFYLPMVEVISYLSNNGFAVYIDSACGVDTTRELVGNIIPIAPDRIIASDFVYTTTNMGKDKAKSHFYDRHNEKVIISGDEIIENAQTVKIFSILNQIGKKPVLAFGNTMGDSGMFEYVLQDNPYNSAAFCVLCDDTERELGNLEKAGKMQETADKRGWYTISMRNDWKTIYGDNVTREK